MMLVTRAGVVPAMRWGPVRCSGAVGTRLALRRPGARQYHPWVRPALLVAGGITLTVAAWPVMRYVVLGALGYGVYRSVRVLLMLRDLKRLATGGGLWSQMAAGLGMGSVAPAVLEAMQQAAQAGLRAACADPGVAQVLRADADDVELDSPVDVQTAAATGHASRVEAVFPVRVAGQGVPVFVQAVATTGTHSVDYNARVDELRVLVRQPSGEVLVIPISAAADGPKPRPARNVRDADYRDL
ncbi:hypothetical protein IWQ56_000147 [Coemansia nantahalensis]|uniref:Uncharacterized protein n=2 Tax=Coemansia TaxID=4863 RepID=A0ACC1LEB2_9FUNG|nr:hypothetical protein IWQ57_000485 [Coemansia nantahalensis]KAJ2775300.1 hypothetical protein IWQ56_000147 [Coemansia nantahalensis]KAJ2806390.1 hypothetical protein H4R21_000883 [Coemansia helicoidea]